MCGCSGIPRRPTKKKNLKSRLDFFRSRNSSAAYVSAQPNMSALEAGSGSGGGGGGGAATAGSVASLPSDPLHHQGAPGGSASGKPVHKLNRRNIKAQVKRFKMETKAAKTLGIIVGGFICCWMPFFTMYVIRAFCEKCIPSVLFSVLFWLGYCNSAINPCIYALFSKDFRFAFQKILCQCLCTKKAHSHSSIQQVAPHPHCYNDSEYADEQSESN